jgi:hypothetical protein
MTPPIRNGPCIGATRSPHLPQFHPLRAYRGARVGAQHPRVGDDDLAALGEAADDLLGEAASE